MTRVDLRVGERLAIGFALAALLLTGIVAMSQLAFRDVARLREHATQVVNPQVVAAEKLERLVLTRASAVRAYALTQTSKDLEEVERFDDEIRSALSALSSSADEGSSRSPELRAIVQREARLEREIAAFATAVRRANVAQLREAEDSMARAREDMLAPLREYRRLQTFRLEQARSTLEVFITQTRRALWVAFPLLISIVALSGWLTARSVRRPVFRMLHASRAMSEGDYAPALALRSPSSESGGASRDELLQLSDAFGQMAGGLRLREDRLKAGVKIATSLAASLDSKRLCKGALDDIVDHVGAEVGVVYVLSEDEPRLNCAATFAFEGNVESLALGEGLPGEVLARGATLTVRDIPEDSPFRIRFGVDQVPPRCIVAVPIAAHGRSLGVLLVAGLRELSPDAVSFMEKSGSQLAVAIENSKNHERAERYATDLAVKNELLQTQNEELQVQQEEIHAQNEELQTQNEDLQAQSEELRTQGEELRTTVDALAESEDRFRRAIAGAPFPLMLHDEEGTVLELSRSWSESTGFGREQIPNIQTFIDKASGKDNETANELRAGLDAFEHRVFDGEYGVVTASGESLVWSIGSAPLGEVAGKRLAISMAVDVTARKRAEEALLEADARKDEFLAMLSHELRNPLAPIRNSLHILRRTEEGSEQFKRAQVIIERQVEHLTRLVDDLLDVTRITRGKIRLQRASLNLKEVLRLVSEDLEGLFASNDIRFEKKVPAQVVPIEGDAVRVAQIVGNLLQNAAKFTPGGGLVRLSLEKDERRGKAIIRVEDSGLGIDPQIRERLFEPFSQDERTLARSRGGLGLGLALVKGLVELHGGKVSVESAGTGRGSEFRVEFPLVEHAAQPDIPPSGMKLEDTARRILIIEDNIDAAESLQECLRLRGHVVDVAHDGKLGLDKAKSFRPDVVLCDIGLPGMDGFEVARAFRADVELREAYLIALTGYALADDRSRAAAASFHAHVAKPASLDELEKLLGALPDRPS